MSETLAKLLKESEDRYADPVKKAAWLAKLAKHEAGWAAPMPIYPKKPGDADETTVWGGIIALAEIDRKFGITSLETVEDIWKAIRSNMCQLYRPFIQPVVAGYGDKECRFRIRSMVCKIRVLANKPRRRDTGRTYALKTKPA